MTQANPALPHLQLEFVSDIACPWCAVGAWALDAALSKLGGELTYTLACLPFELNPDMPPEGEDATEHICRKYGITPEQVAVNREGLRQRGAAEGFQFGQRVRVWNTFDAHRLLHWAGLQGRQWSLKKVLLQAYHGDGMNPGDHAVLTRAAEQAGLNPLQAAQVLQSGSHAADVRAQQRWVQQAGIQSVPGVIINRAHLIQGGQPAQVFEQALRQMAAQTAAAPVNQAAGG
jgi:predicted DsbA family dithiol-disulfide isomerase